MKQRQKHTSTNSIVPSFCMTSYCKTSNISHTQSQNFSDFRVALQLSLADPLKPGVKSRMKMWLEQRQQAMLQLHLSD